jgi:hypothetical protein
MIRKENVNIVEMANKKGIQISSGGHFNFFFVEMINGGFLE